jgi:hypothetical protein
MRKEGKSLEYAPGILYSGGHLRIVLHASITMVPLAVSIVQSVS